MATWNIENAFDTVHDEGKDDHEFLPQAERRWHSGRYWRKLRGITQTLAAMELPALVGFQEALKLQSNLQTALTHFNLTELTALNSLLLVGLSSSTQAWTKKAGLKCAKLEHWL